MMGSLAFAIESSVCYFYVSYLNSNDTVPRIVQLSPPVLCSAIIAKRLPVAGQILALLCWLFGSVASAESAPICFCHALLPSRLSRLRIVNSISVRPKK